MNDAGKAVDTYVCQAMEIAELRIGEMSTSDAITMIGNLVNAQALWDVRERIDALTLSVDVMGVQND